jgi:threonine/homoserine efflux transporter RhtA
MRALVAAAVLASAIVLGPTVASAQERVGETALGALSGALVGGPVGLVVGGVIGFTAGPSISNAMFHNQRRPRRYSGGPRGNYAQ